MIYKRKDFDVKEKELIREMCERFSFVSLVSLSEEGEPFFSHIPVVFNFKSDEIKISGHLSKHNPHWIHLQKNPSAQIVVSGPDAYITPLYYRSGRDVPTWNYVRIHLKGDVQIQFNAQPILQNVVALTKKFEVDQTKKWTFSLPDDLKSNEQIEEALVGFELTVKDVEAKFKLSQNRPVMDQQGIIEGLLQRSDVGSQQIADLMKRNLANKST